VDSEAKQKAEQATEEVRPKARACALRLVAKMFAGSRSGQVERHLSRDEITEIAEGMFLLGYEQGYGKALDP
jgi:hypothetical protein